jgi:tetratricopeptide (TPR) repeat protein
MNRRLRPAALALAVSALFSSGALVAQRSPDIVYTGDPALDPGIPCAPQGGRPALLEKLILAQTGETKPFVPPPPKADLTSAPPLFDGLGATHIRVTTRDPKAQKYFDQGLRLSYAFNHAEAQRAFREAQRLDPDCAMCFWGEALVLGPNINVPMMPEAQAPAVAALKKAQALAPKASEKERALIEALGKRYADPAPADRAPLDMAFADAMVALVAKYPADDQVRVLAAEALMDTQPWDYWEAAGAKPKARAAEIVSNLETVLKRNPSHPGAIHLYIHAMEASTKPERALEPARRLAALMPSAGHIVHMPAHIYYRLGLWRESLESNKKAMAVDERYFSVSPSDPLYKSAYYPHNIHFVMVSAQMGGDRATAIEAAGKLDRAIPDEVAKMFAIMQPVKAAPYSTHAQFSDAATILALPEPHKDLILVTAMYHYARAVAHAQKKDEAAARAEIDALAKMAKETDFKPFGEWQIPAKEIIETAMYVAQGRLADAKGDLEGAGKAYEEAVLIEDSLSYMEPPYWYYPVRQSLASVRLRQGNLDAAEKAFRESLGRVRNNGWALAGLAEVYKRKGDAAMEKKTRAAMGRAWFGDAKGPDLASL